MSGEHHVWLASRSPRRRELLGQIGVRFRVVDVDVDESVRRGESAPDTVARLAAAKAEAGIRLRPPGDATPVLGADTEVVLDGATLGKPADPAGAAAMLARLSGRAHEVVSAVAIADGARALTLVSTTRVEFRDLEAAEIEAYCATGEPLDKAGAYGIQGLAGAFVARIDGSYSGVVGLPLCETAALLRDFGIDILPRSTP